MSDELLPCPFCGGGAEMQDNFGRDWFVQCKSCDASHGTLAADRTEAKSTWNARAPSTQPAVPSPVVADAKARYDELTKGEDYGPIENLRFFCSLAMSGQDWIDVEPFFDALTAPPAPASRVPLSEEDVDLLGIKECHRGKYPFITRAVPYGSELHGFVREIVRRTEAAHGIVEPARGSDEATGQMKNPSPDGGPNA